MASDISWSFPQVLFSQKNYDRRVYNKNHNCVHSCMGAKDKALHEQDQTQCYDAVYLSYALSRNFPNGESEFSGSLFFHPEIY